MTDVRPHSLSSLAVTNRARARREGIPVTALLGRNYSRWFYDAYVPAGNRHTLRERATVALALTPAGTRASHHTAVSLWGGVAPDSADIHLSTTTAGDRSRRRGIAAHLVDPAGAVTNHRGIPISTPVQAFLELAASGVSLVDLVVAGDSLVKATDTPPEAFVVAADDWRGRRARIAREAARLVRAGVDSPMETRLRLLLVFAGLPEPRVNVILRHEDGQWRCRFDLAYERWKVIVEYDGRQHAEDDEQWGHDLVRREELDRLGWRLIVVRAEGIYTDPERTLRRVRDALRQQGARGLPDEFRPEWCRQFPARSARS